VGNEWIKDYTRRSNLQMEHLEQKLNQMINGRVDSKSPDDTRIKAIELTARLKGLLDTRSQTNVTLVQPILAGQSVRKPGTSDVIIDGDTVTPETVTNT
jgi:hypothetical protein